jgi:hypothetical protein
MNKGIVMEMNESQIIVMTPEGDFTQIPLDQRKCQVGEEILYTVAVHKKRAPWIAISSSVAAAAVVLLLLFNSLSGNGTPTPLINNQVVAYISIDINPSIELGIDANNIVRVVRGLNDDGTALIKNVKIEGKNIDQATEALLQEAESKYLSKGVGDIVISSTLEKTTADVNVNDVALSNKLKEDVIQHIQKSHPKEIDQFQVTSFAAPKEARAAAESNGLSTGKYSIYLSAKDNGQETTIDEFKKDSIYTIAKAKGGLNQLIKTENLSKDKILALVDDEQSGSLDRKLAQQVQAQQNADNKKNTNGTNNSDSKKNNGKSNAKTTSKPSPRSSSNSASPTPSKNDNGNKQDDNSKATSKPTIKPTSTPTATDKNKDNNKDSKKDNKNKDKATPTPAEKSSDAKQGDNNNSANGDSGQKPQSGSD